MKSKFKRLIELSEKRTTEAMEKYKEADNLVEESKKFNGLAIKAAYDLYPKGFMEDIKSIILDRGYDVEIESFLELERKMNSGELGIPECQMLIAFEKKFADKHPRNLGFWGHLNAIVEGGLDE